MIQIPKITNYSSSPQFFLGWQLHAIFACVCWTVQRLISPSCPTSMSLQNLLSYLSIDMDVLRINMWACVGLDDHLIIYMLSAHASLIGLTFFCFSFHCFYSQKILFILHSRQSMILLQFPTNESCNFLCFCLFLLC